MYGTINVLSLNNRIFSFLKRVLCKFYIKIEARIKSKGTILYGFYIVSQYCFPGGNFCELDGLSCKLPKAGYDDSRRKPEYRYTIIL